MNPRPTDVTVLGPGGMGGALARLIEVIGPG